MLNRYRVMCVSKRMCVVMGTRRRMVRMSAGVSALMAIARSGSCWVARGAVMVATGVCIGAI